MPKDRSFFRPLPGSPAYGLPLQPAAPQAESAPESAPPIEIKDEAGLWQRWFSHREERVRALLAEHYLSYTQAMAAKCYSRRVHNEFEFAEYFHFAVVGMMESLDRYMPDRGVQFTTFATPRINGAILNGLAGLSERQQQVALQHRLASERLESLQGAGDLQGLGHQLLKALGEIGIGIALGFLLDGTGMVMSEDQMLPDNAYCHIELRQLREKLWQLVGQLTEREMQVIHRHYLQQQPFEEIATGLQLTKGRVSQLHRQGLERLRSLMKTQSLDMAI